MRLEHIPLIIGAIVALIGLAFIADALMADNGQPKTERRRRMRAERSRPGEAIVGIGTLCMAAALIGRDTWRYGTLAVMIGAGLVLIGIILNRTFLKEALFFRGPARRADPMSLDSPHPRGHAKSASAPRATGGARPEASQPAVRPERAPPPSRPDPVPPTARADAAPPTGPVDRRKTPRGK